MTEVSLFITVGAVAVVAAVLMLLSANAVHSALFLILNFACVAFMYLLLNAPFLAMVQITVYAGAIMVLFLFVIMLLGGEQVDERETRFRWLAPVALVLSVLFLLTSGYAIISGQIDMQAPAQPDPMVRVLHVAPDVGAVDIYANNELVVSNVEYPASTEFLTVPPGEYTFTVNPAGLASPLLSQTVSLEPGNVYNAVALGEGPLPVLRFVAQDLSTVEARSGRVLVYNAFTGTPTASLVDLGSEFDANDTRVIVPELEQGEASEAFVADEGRVNWTFIAGDQEDEVLHRLREFDLTRNTSELIVLTGERLFDGTLRAVALPLSTQAVAEFGSPQALGQSLFTKFVLPFQLVSIVLLAAMIGAIVLTHDEDRKVRVRPSIEQRRKVSRPLTSVISTQTGHDVMVPLPDNAGEAKSELPEPAGD